MYICVCRVCMRVLKTLGGFRFKLCSFTCFLFFQNKKQVKLLLPSKISKKELNLMLGFRFTYFSKQGLSRRYYLLDFEHLVPISRHLEPCSTSFDGLRVATFQSPFLVASLSQWTNSGFPTLRKA